MSRLANSVVQVLDRSLPKLPVVFDCGSGEGRLAEALLDRLPPADPRVILIDIDLGAVTSGVRRLAGGSVYGVCADLEALPVRPSTGSVFVLSHVLYYVRDRERVILDLLLRHPGSVVVVVVRDAACVTARLWRHVMGAGRRATNSEWLRNFVLKDARIEATETENLTDMSAVLVDLADFMLDVNAGPVTSSFVEAVVYRSPITDPALYGRSVDFFSTSVDLVIREHVFVLRAERSAA